MFTFSSTLVPPSGVEFALFAHLTPSTLLPIPSRPSSLGIPIPPGRVISNLIVAREGYLRIFEVREEASILTDAAPSKENNALRRGQEENQGIEDGDGFLDMGIVDQEVAPMSTPKTIRLKLVLAHQLHGKVTGMVSIRTPSTVIDGLDRILISYEEAKMAILEWSEEGHDLQTVSLHTYERTPQVASANPGSHIPLLRSEPNSHCVTLLLPQDTLAVLPISSGADMDEDDSPQRRELPYNPSYLLPLSTLSQTLKSVVDYTFLPGYTSPTIALLYSTTPTWSARGHEEERDPVSVSFYTLDISNQSYPQLSNANGLPVGCEYIVPCPTAIPGVMVVSPNGLIHVDPAGRVTATSVNGFWGRETNLKPSVELKMGLRLEGSRLSFVSSNSSSEPEAILILKTGEIYVVEFERDGRALSKINIRPKEVVEKGPTTSVVLSLGDEGLCFLGSLLGDSVLAKVYLGKEVVRPVENQFDVDDDDMELDEDIYGPSANWKSSTTQRSTYMLPTVPKPPFEICDFIPDHGSTSDGIFGLSPLQTRKNAPAQLISVSGSGWSGRLNFFHKEMPARKKRRIEAISSSQGVWSIRVPRSKTQGVPERDSLLIIDEKHESGGHTKIFAPSSKGELMVIRRIPDSTIETSEFFQNTCFVHVTSSSVNIVDGDGRDRSLGKKIQVKSGRKFVAASIEDPYVAVLDSEGEVSVFAGDVATGQLTLLTPELKNTSTKYDKVLLFTDTSGTFSFRKKEFVVESNGIDRDDWMYGEAEAAPVSIESMTDAGKGMQWMCTYSSDGLFEILSLPSQKVVFSNNGLSILPQLLYHDPDASALPAPMENQEETGTSHREEFQSVALALVGEVIPTPHLLLLTNSSQLIAYEVSPILRPLKSLSQSTGSETVLFSIRFKRVFAETLPSASVNHHITPTFKTFSKLKGLTGAFLTGAEPRWIVKGEKSPLFGYRCSEANVQAFATSSFYGHNDAFLWVNENGSSLSTFLPNINIDLPMPSRKVLHGREYTHITYDPPSRHLIAAANFTAPFQIFDEDNNRNIPLSVDSSIYPTTERSSLELIDFESCQVIDGFEFSQDEQVISLLSCRLASQTTALGRHDYVAVGTGTFRGEDLVAKGALYLFEVTEVVPVSPADDMSRFKLKLLCSEEYRGPVTALSEMNNYLVVGMGQKVFVKSFELDSRLLAVAFMDVSFYTTSIKVLKNFLLIGDAQKSVWFVAFQEDPFKMVLISKDYEDQHVTSADFLVLDGDISFVVQTLDGYVRILEYSPTHIDSHAGQRLLYRSEYNLGLGETSKVLTVARQSRNAAGREGVVLKKEITKEDEEDTNASLSPQSHLVIISASGAISTFAPVSESSFKPLSLLSTALLREIPHVSGLNPRAFRTVKNDFVSRPLVKGVLDGDLLKRFADGVTDRNKMDDLCKRIGTNVNGLLRDVDDLSGGGSF